MAIFSGILRIVDGFVAALQDYLSVAGPPFGPFYWPSLQGVSAARVRGGLLVWLSNFPLLTGTGAPTELAWAGWAAGVGTTTAGLVGALAANPAHLRQ